jgi:hypothetical protein
MSGRWSLLRSAAVAATVTAVLAFAGAALAASTAPAIAAFTPTTAKTAASITITGTHFTSVKTVKVGTMAMKFKVDSTKKIVATLPSKAKSGKIVVTTKTGTATSSKSLTVT